MRPVSVLMEIVKLISTAKPDASKYYYSNFLPPWEIFMLLCCQLIFFPKIILGIPSECKTDWIQIRLTFVGPDLVPNCLQKLPAGDTRR